MSGALHNLTYRRLLLAQIFSVLGSGLTTIALGLLAFEMAGGQAGAVLGIALAIKMVAYVGVAPIATTLAERLPRKGFLIALDLARACLVLSLPFVTEIWHIYALVFGFQAFSAGFTPTFQATIPDILTDEGDYTQALSYSRLTYDLEALLGPLIAGAALTVLTFNSLFVGTAIGFLLSAGLVMSVRLPRRKHVPTAAFSKRLTRGLWIYLATPRLRGVLALYVAVAAATAMVIVNTVVLVKDVLGQGDGLVAIFFAASGCGSMVVALALPKLLGETSPRPVMLAGGVILSFGLGVAALSDEMWVGLILWFVIGAGASLIQTPTGLLLTWSCHSQDRPAVFAAQFALSHSAWLLAYPLAGVLGGAVGLPITFATMAALACLATFGAAKLWPAIDPLALEHEHDATVPPHAEGDETQTGGSYRHRHAFVIDDAHPTWPTS
ncbi:MFS transporter [uncultured Pelagimonas sp.]|uniref:MFS transporter n=1 Tax=uncultured Pelagimonas sp. TaxID=1618102 RepID=UPI00261BE7B5|nr:MFS transporter [uncultured Pelagimonas sp.]